MERQLQHLLLLLSLLIMAAWWFQSEGMSDGSCLGVSTASWFWWSIAFPILHQLWVVVCWRLELYRGSLSKALGQSGFRLYAAGFALFSAGRIFTMIALAVANQGTLAVDPRLTKLLALAVAVPATYTFYSVGRYFTFRRALGIDHFDPAYRDAPLIRQGIFRFTRNGMYIFGMAAFWIPGLVWSSKAGLLSAAFTHAFIWVHYFCTELPDMRHIYGKHRV